MPKAKPGRKGGRRRGLAPLSFRLSDAEWEVVTAAAGHAGMKPAAYSRSVTLAAAGAPAPIAPRKPDQPAAPIRDLEIVYD